MNSHPTQQVPAARPIAISIITAVYNRAKTLSTALDSIAQQQYQPLQHVVIDGASTDGTLNILEQRRGELSVLVSEPDHGVYDALNKGLALANGEVIGFLHSDDLFAHTRVLSRVAAAFEETSVEAVYGDLQYVAAENTEQIVRHWGAGNYSRNKLDWGWMPPHPTLFMRRHVYEKFGGFDPSFRIAADYDHILRCLGRGGVRAVYIPEVLVKMRVGGISNRSIRHMLRKSSEDLRAMRNNHIGGIGALAWKNLSKIPQFVTRQP